MVEKILTKTKIGVVVGIIGLAVALVALVLPVYQLVQSTNDSLSKITADIVALDQKLNGFDKKLLEVVAESVQQENTRKLELMGGEKGPIGVEKPAVDEIEKVLNTEPISNN